MTESIVESTASNKKMDFFESFVPIDPSRTSYADCMLLASREQVFDHVKELPARHVGQKTIKRGLFHLDQLKSIMKCLNHVCDARIIVYSEQIKHTTEKTNFFASIILLSSLEEDRWFGNLYISSDAQLQIFSDKDICEDITESLAKKISEHLEAPETNGVTFEWMYLGAGNRLCSSFFYRNPKDVFVDGAYPFIENLDAFADNFLEAKEKILILYGPPGTGKTRFVNKLFERKHGKRETGKESQNILVRYTNDESLLRDEQFFMGFLRGNAEFMLLEDIDCNLASRREGKNSVVNKILNASDGAINFDDKKIIITTNLGLNNIDSALLRPGRCWAKINFRELGQKEAIAFIVNYYEGNPDEHVINLLDYKDSYSLAELYYLVNNRSLPLSDSEETKGVGFMYKESEKHDYKS